MAARGKNNKMKAREGNVGRNVFGRYGSFHIKFFFFYIYSGLFSCLAVVVAAAAAEWQEMVSSPALPHIFTPPISISRATVLIRLAGEIENT